MTASSTDTTWARLDATIGRAERALALVALLVMALVMFLDVVHRRYTDPESKLMGVAARLVGAVAGDTTWLALQSSAGVVVPLAFVASVYFALRRADASHQPARQRSRAISVGLALVVVAAAWGMLRVLFGAGDPDSIARCGGEPSLSCGFLPNGIVWSMPLALVMTLWVGFLGASMATREHRHLRVEALQRLLPPRAQCLCAAVAGLVTAGLCASLAWLGWRYVGFMFDDWEMSRHLGGLFDGVDIPKWAGFAILPVSYLVMAARFIVGAVRAWRGELPAGLGEQEIERALGGDEEAP